MKRFLIAIACLAFSLTAFAQNGDEPATRDDVMLYFRTVHSFDMLQRTLRVQMQAMQQMQHDQLVKAGKPTADADEQARKVLEEMLKTMPFDQIVDAMIPAYQKHFTRSDVQAMNAFYSSPVGQKALQQLPEVMQDGLQDAMPILNKYIGEFTQRMKSQAQSTKSTVTAADPGAGPNQ